MPRILAEYIWIDGTKPSPLLRSKAKVIDGPVQRLTEIPEWGFDGSSTNQATTGSSDCVLQPVFFCPDPIRGGNNILVMTEVFNADGTVHATNIRAHLREVAAQYATHEPWFGIEQEYTLFNSIQPLGFPEHGFPEPQGKYYCGVGSGRVYGREIVERHTQVCLAAGLRLAGINAEVMPGQWEYQIGPVGPLEVADELWLSRWLLARIAENYNVRVSFDPKPIKGDWNGAGAHTNFSTKAIREPGGMQHIEEACKKLQLYHEQHVPLYGHGNEERLTGQHETCSIREFRYGVSDRGASVRIPLAAAKAGYGYLEDRRPAANCDPYQVCGAIVKTVCGNW
ncbi:MAG: glutamine synthetase [Candidatus Magasanikbacteria bacterium RIFCSPHIGHO2_01_FULL_41_23]|nr:MAG: glutamine synthetase [Candidatus Magasanikbacteria bacterium RIFCSPHIGHO2_01_FULL_41_23]OGH67359.1 MAG: glutamine synthetase [Candidatus Magasanikbacteria bacterium RIFCSPHIGHO2_02_FULL_41_35]OGH74602.1 MAG: glutamine synthetase [Candidatus Magasanikbacteria bacterium RIFCSPHIGHO2_12_FULL_41_16]